jgi:hypothetical protein
MYILKQGSSNIDIVKADLASAMATARQVHEKICAGKV